MLSIPLSDLRLDSDPVGGGGYGDVYRAWCVSRDSWVAVKKLRVAVMNDAALADFYAELSLLHSLPRHAHIVALLGYVVDKPTRSYLMALGQ